MTSPIIQEKNYIAREYIKQCGTLPDEELLQLVLSVPYKKYYCLYHPEKETIQRLLVYKMKFHNLETHTE